MRILVTGGAGFLGSIMCDKLIAQGHEVLCVDNFYSGQRSNIRHLMDHPRFELMRHDVVDPLHVIVDQIYHMACPASPVFYQFQPIETVKTNVMGTLNVLELARVTKARILLTSTSEVYGDPKEHPQKESYWGNVNCAGIRSCYDEGKRCAEALTFDYHREHDVEVRVARIFNSYGPRMMENDGRVVSNFIIQALRDEDITIYGDGSQTRSFCFGEDTVDGLIALMNGDFVGPCNIGRPHENTIKELADFVLELIPASKSKLQKFPLPKDDPTRRLPDISLAKEHLKWEPKVPLRDGLVKTIEYFRTRMTSPDVVNSPCHATRQLVERKRRRAAAIEDARDRLEKESKTAKTSN